MTTTRLHLDRLDLDTLLQERDAAGRNEALALLQQHEETRRENARFDALLAEEDELLRVWAAEREAAELDA